MNRKRILGAVAAGILVAAGIGGGFAFASGGTDQPTIGLNAAGQEFFCIGSDGVMHVNPTFNNSTCPAGTKGLNYPVSGAAVAKAVGPQLPAPATLSWGHGDITDGPTPLDHIGGPIRTNGTVMPGSITGLEPGVYELFVNSSFTRTAAASASDSDTFPVLTAWKSTAAAPDWAADFSNTVITINGGMMSRGKTIDQTVNGSALITINSTSDQINFVAFAYDEDAGSTGAVQIDNSVYSMIQLDSNPSHGG